MRNQHSILAVALLATALSCVHKETGPERVTFKAIMAEDPATRTVLQSDGSVFWSPGDAINLFYGTSFAMLTADNTAASAQASFTGELDGFLPNGQDEFWAVYPYSSANRFDGSAVTLTLPNQQNGVAGTFDADLFVSLARSKDYILQFYNLCGGVKFSVAQTGIQYVTFRGNANEILAGQVTVAFDTDGKPQVQDVLKGATELRLNAPEGGFEVGKWYYIVSLPVILSAGYTMTFFKDASGTVAAERAVETSVTIKRSTWGRLTDADDVTTPINPNKYLTFTSEGTTTVSLTNNGGNAPVLYYSKDTNTWFQWDYSELTFTANEPLHICGDNPQGLSHKEDGVEDASYSQFVSSGDSFSISGDIMSLLNKDTDLLAIPSSWCFLELFRGCANITAAPSLPATELAPYCYYNMFMGCSSLTAAPELPATTMTEGCYTQMFRECSSLSAVPQLPATVLARSCYSFMFSDCTGITSVPEDYLPVTQLEDLCYGGLFQNCKNLTNAPSLPSTTLARQCYFGMFNGCSLLQTAPELPATTLAERCYRFMFSGCSSLSVAPALPAETLEAECYYGMFQACSGLTSAPVLPASVLAEKCYYLMFQSCTNLQYVSCLATDISASDCLERWLAGVAATGTFVKAANVEWSSGPSGIPEGWTVETAGESAISPAKYLTFNSEGSSTVFLVNDGGNAPLLYYSTDTYTWQQWDYGYLNFTSDNPVYICGNNPDGFSLSDTKNSVFRTQGDPCSISGDIMSLLDYTEDLYAIPNEGCFSSLFVVCYNLTSGPALPATTLSKNCYNSMFRSCTGLLTAPNLPASILANSCYSGMFNGCSNLATPPRISATEMAYGSCGSMFGNCTSLVTAPDLPAEVLEEACYFDMFKGCTSLTTVPLTLPATTLARLCYRGMFEDCTSLTSAPELPASTLAEYCYMNMFNNCTKLNYVKCLATDFGNGNSSGIPTEDWLNGVSTTGTFVKAANVEWPSGVSGIPEGWTVEEL